MKKLVFSIVLLFLVLPLAALADSFDALWKQVEVAKKKDLPKTELVVLEKIATKAETEKAYGHLLKAELRHAALMVEVAPDSLKPVVGRLEKRAEVIAKRAEDARKNGVASSSDDVALAAVYNVIVGKIYKDSRIDDEDRAEKSKEYFRRAFKDREILAMHKAAEYEPMVLKGAESRYFDNDLFSMLGFEAEAYHKMHKFYSNKGNRVAAMYLALKIIERDYQENRDSFYPKGIRNYDESLYKAKLDSLINEYGDLKECGEVAIALYEYMNGFHDIPVSRKIAFIDNALSRWGAWMSMDVLRNYRSSLTQPMFHVSADKNAALPGKAFGVQVKVRNMKKLTLTITKTMLSGDTRLNPENANEYNKIKAALVKNTAQTITCDYSDKKEYETTNDTINVEGLPVGVYLMVFDAPNTGTSSRRCLLYVTDMYVLNIEQPGNTRRFSVVSGTTGQPVPNAKIELLFEGKRLETLACGSNGEAMLKTTKNFHIRAVTTGDNACPFVNSWNRFSYYGEAKDCEIVNLYTDRGIYRPGQTVHVSAIAFKNEHGKELSALAGKEIKLTLKDANYKVVKEAQVRTDDFGNASAQFVLPATGLTGRFTISSDVRNNNSASIRVEQYKRPTFRVEFDEVKDKYANGDTVTVTGRATTFSGVPVQGAKVSYKVNRSLRLWWRMPDNSNTDNCMAEGEIETDSDGTFRVRMPMVLPVVYGQDKYASCLYGFITTVDVTDQGGETHSGEITLMLGNKPVFISCNMPDRIERDSLKTVTFELKNAAGVGVQGTVKYYIDNPVNEYVVEAGTPVALQWGERAKASSGKHQLVAICEGDTLRKDFVLFSMDDTVPCYDTEHWQYCSKDQFPNDGRPVYLQIGSSNKDVHVVYSLIAGNNVLENGTFRLDNSVMTRKLEYKEEYGDGITYSYAWVKDGKSYRMSWIIRRPLPDKKLRVKWTTFRDRLTPGQKETWTLNVTNPDGTPANAHLLAAMYDKSLDQIVPFSWNFNDRIQLNNAFASWSDTWHNNIMLMVSKNYKLLPVKEMAFNRLDFSDCWALLRSAFYGGAKLMAAASGMRMRETSEAKIMRSKAVQELGYDEALSEAVVGSNSAVYGGEDKLFDAAPIEEAEEDTGTVTGQVRENMNETAFFYPALVADENGNVAISFTLPESVTTWKFMGLAYDKAMNRGLIDGEAVAKKDVMVLPNVPRFVRQGDNAVISARIINTSEKTIEGMARILLVEPETEKTVLEHKRKFIVEANQTGNVSFVMNIDGLDNTLYICKVIAEGKTFSDGEQHYLPILPNAELITNTLPFTILEKGKKALNIENLMPQDKTSKKLTVEYAANPAWLMAQALPFVGNSDEDNAISLAAAYYANSLASNIIGKSPDVEKIFKQWQQEQGTEKSLMSNLQKNEDLKSIALDETPWVMDADRETDRKAAIANFFDKNTLDYNINKTITALRKLQNADGSFSWWKGMDGSMYMTATVMEFIARLDAMGAGRSDTKVMMNNAAKYLGEQVVKEVAEAKKYMKKGDQTPVCSSAALQFAYINALTGRKLSAKEASAEEFVIKGYDEDKRNQSLYVKAVMAFILSKKSVAQAKEYAQSLKEYTVYKEDMGRYYDTPRAGYSWCDYRIPTHTMAIEALQAITPNDTQTIDEMRRWLLQEKRTQAWDTPINSVNAVYAFLNGKVEVLKGNTNVDISIDGKKVETSKATAGVGYVKVKNDVTSAKKITIDKQNDGTSWGAVYVQFMQPLKDVQNATSGLSVTREIIGKDKSGSIKVGDRIKVRITINAERDYDFVQVVDKRAACLEPIGQLSGYHGRYYIAPKDNATYYYFNMMRKGKHVIETEYFVDRIGTYQTGTCTVQCAYSPEFMARTAAEILEIK